MTDAMEDERFRQNGFVVGEPNIRFYAGYPIKIRQQHAVCTLCAIDTRPRHFTDRDLAIMADLARIAEDEFELRRTAEVDILTNALSRRAFKSRGLRLVQGPLSDAKPLSVIMLDIDRFKTINDTHGHAVGDKVLTAVGAICRSQLRSGDLFGRLGGEEFAIMLQGTGREGAIVVAEKLRRAIANTPIVADHLRFNITASLGIATATSGMASLEALLNAADKALYEAKAHGRDRVAVAV